MVYSVPPASAGSVPAAQSRLQPPTSPTGADAAAREAANSLEALFLAQMLQISGVGAAPEGFGGGAGEEQFASFQTEALARRIVDAGGIGLAEQLFAAMVEARGGTA